LPDALQHQARLVLGRHGVEQETQRGGDILAIDAAVFLTQLPHFDDFNSRKAAEFCDPSQWRSNCGAKYSPPFWRIFRLDRLGHGVLAFRADEDISLHETPKIKVLLRFSCSDLFKLSLPDPARCGA
jgi:hypothetical protein